MRVCHMTSAHDPEDVRIFVKECVSLAKEGYKVSLIQCGGSYNKQGVKIIGFGKPSASRLKRFILDSKKTYKAALKEDADLYHFHDPELIPYALKLKRKGKKVIFDSHENTADAILEKPYLPYCIRGFVRHAYKAMEKYACLKFDAVITVTPTQTDYFKKMGVHTVEVKNFPILPEKFNEPTYSEKKVVFAGGISKQWNHHTLIDAIKDMPECKYILIGQDNEYRKSLENLQGWDKVDYLGRKTHHEVMSILSECMIGVALLSPGNNTAWSTGTLGNTKIFEEMIAGLPVVCTNFDLWKEFVEKYECGICVDPTDALSIQKAIDYLICNPDICRKMGLNGQKAIREKYNWNFENKELLKLYRNIYSLL